ncbi:uncharacterized protein K444DRAFT_697363 [Hyaloscypha bicolor E]|uniref:Uncharacterized protein n=1 Tax=Hyaloscypha bicolor E TaxID=1095630 RepID=A0A2J6SX49_9HELO|nr:uncharacterized protein K444DRAFT_697363 [Hyaloscypha bicolor E]PMD55350.1 hypothetical protein K444DRAFT_697363 [Hyaloscypha bicolor E]
MVAQQAPRTNRVVNKEKEAKKALLTRKAIDGKATALKKQDNGTQKAEAILAKIVLLEKIEQKERTEAVLQELAELNQNRMEYDMDIEKAKSEEVGFEQEILDADQMDIYDEVDPDEPLTSTDRLPPPLFTVNRDLAALLSGASLSGDAENLDLDEGSGLRPAQHPVGYKGGISTTAIVGDFEVKNFPIYRLRTDIAINDDEVPNIMERRRGGKNKPLSKEKWRKKDIKAIKGIAIAVPCEYPGKPEDLVAQIKPISEKKKIKLKKNGKKVPKQPDVQLLIEWREPLVVETPSGPQSVSTSWESRSGCGRIWNKKIVPDLMCRYAKFHEVNYRRHGGEHGSEERSISPFEIPSAGVTPDPDSDTDSDLDSEEEIVLAEAMKKAKKAKKAAEKKAKEEAEKPKEEVEKPKEEVEKPKEKVEKPKEKVEKPKEKKEGASAYEDGMAKFDLKFRMVRKINQAVDLTSEQAGDFIDAYDSYWAKQGAKVISPV